MGVFLPPKRAVRRSGNDLPVRCHLAWGDHCAASIHKTSANPPVFVPLRKIAVQGAWTAKGQTEQILRAPLITTSVPRQHVRIKGTEESKQSVWGVQVRILGPRSQWPKRIREFTDLKVGLHQPGVPGCTSTAALSKRSGVVSHNVWRLCQERPSRLEPVFEQIDGMPTKMVLKSAQ